MKDYIHRLDNFDGPAVGEIAVGYEMFDEAFEIYKQVRAQDAGHPRAAGAPRGPGPRAGVRAQGAWPGSALLRCLLWINRISLPVHPSQWTPLGTASGLHARAPGID